MKRIAVVGTGRVGSATAFHLLENEMIDKVLLVNRTRELAECLKHDLMGTYPEFADKVDITSIGALANVDVVLITQGLFAAPVGGELLKTNAAMIEQLFASVDLSPNCKIVITTTPCDQLAQLCLELSGLKPQNIIGFGGQLDTNRLRYLIHIDNKKPAEEILAHHIGEHGKRGIPVFRDEVKDREKIVEHAKNYFKHYLARGGASTYGTARELSRLTGILLSDDEKVVDISYYHEEYGMFITWPCVVNNRGVIRAIEIELHEDEIKELEQLVETRKQEITRGRDK